MIDPKARQSLRNLSRAMNRLAEALTERYDAGEAEDREAL